MIKDFDKLKYLLSELLTKYRNEIRNGDFDKVVYSLWWNSDRYNGKDFKGKTFLGYCKSLGMLSPHQVIVEINNTCGTNFKDRLLDKDNKDYYYLKFIYTWYDSLHPEWGPISREYWLQAYSINGKLQAQFWDITTIENRLCFDSESEANNLINRIESLGHLPQDPKKRLDLSKMKWKTVKVNKNSKVYEKLGPMVKKLVYMNLSTLHEPVSETLPEFYGYIYSSRNNGEIPFSDDDFVAESLSEAVSNSLYNGGLKDKKAKLDNEKMSIKSLTEKTDLTYEPELVQKLVNKYATPELRKSDLDDIWEEVMEKYDNVDLAEEVYDSLHAWLGDMWNESFKADNIKDEEPEDWLTEKRNSCIRDYRMWAGLGDDELITEDKIDEWALNRVSCNSNYDYDDLKEVLLSNK